MGSSPYGRVVSRPNWERKSKQSAKFGRYFGKFEAKRFSLGLIGFCSLILLTFFSVSKLFNSSTPLPENKEAVGLIESAPNGQLEEIIAKLSTQLEDIGSRNEAARNNSRNMEEISVSKESDSTQSSKIQNAH